MKLDLHEIFLFSPSQNVIRQSLDLISYPPGLFYFFMFLNFWVIFYGTMSHYINFLCSMSNWFNLKY